MDTVKNYWESFRKVYGPRDGLIALMVDGDNHDTCVKYPRMKEEFRKNVHFGIVKPKNDDDRVYKMELRMKKDGIFEKYFQNDWEEMRRSLSGLGVVLYDDPTIHKNEDVIALKFRVEKEEMMAEFGVIFWVFQRFKEIVLNQVLMEE